MTDGILPLLDPFSTTAAAAASVAAGVFVQRTHGCTQYHCKLQSPSVSDVQRALGLTILLTLVLPLECGLTMRPPFVTLPFVIRFGNLVTMAKWEELWLNEGFASYLEFLGVDAFLPTYGYFRLMFTKMTAAALASDVLPSAHPLSAAGPLKTVADIDGMFDEISYEKVRHGINKFGTVPFLFIVSRATCLSVWLRRR